MYRNYQACAIIPAVCPSHPIGRIPLSWTNGKENMDKVQSRTYELTYLIAGSMTDSEVAQVRTEIEALLKKYKAEVLKNEDWGRRPLAYVITHNGKKNNDAMYVHLSFKADSNQVQALERDVYLSNKVMRHLLLVADDEVESPEKSI